MQPCTVEATRKADWSARKQSTEAEHTTQERAAIQDVEGGTSFGRPTSARGGVTKRRKSENGESGRAWPCPSSPSSHSTTSCDAYEINCVGDAPDSENLDINLVRVSFTTRSSSIIPLSPFSHVHVQPTLEVNLGLGVPSR
jgi:hypothetical protein